MNLYGFAGGDPVNFSDPFGLCPACEALKVVAKGAAKGGAAAAVDGPFPVGDVIGAVILMGSVVEAAHLLRGSDKKPSVYHRFDVTGGVETGLVVESGEVWGRAPRNTFASDRPQVKAYRGPLPPGKAGYEFATSVAPDAGTPPDRASWSGNRPGVVNEGDYAKIRVTVTRTSP